MLRIETMDRDRTRQLAREFAARKVAAAKAKGRHQIALILPVETIALIDEVKDAHAYLNRSDALSFVLGTIRESPEMRKELGLMTP